MPTITAILILNPTWFGVDKHLTHCLKSVDWCSSRLLVVSQLTPKIQELADDHNATIVLQEGTDFASWRNAAMTHVSSDWVLFIDHDERVTHSLESEINSVISQINSLSGYAIPRLNHILNTPMKYGGWYPDYVLRLIKVNDFIKYQGQLHEQPILKGPTGHLKSYFLHYKHDNLEEMLNKTIIWSDTEAKLLADAKHPPMLTYRFIRPFFTEIGTRLLLKQGLRDGTPGLIDGIYQGFSKLITYIKLWEKQLQTHQNVS